MFSKNRLYVLTLTSVGVFSVTHLACAQTSQAISSEPQEAAQKIEGNNESLKRGNKDGHKKTDPTVVGRDVQKVTISGGRTDMEERRQSTAGKIIFGREELDRNGDSNLGEVLKRLPGVTIGGRPGRGGDIRMRGMGSGYTQILLNGERPPRGFSMDSLSPDQVERIEIIRGPVAEYSTQAIAGTINIILREDYKQKNTDLKFSLGYEQGRAAPNLSVTVPGEIGNLSYAFSGSVFQNRQRDEGSIFTTELGVDGQNSLLQNEFDQSSRKTTGIHLSPRFNYRFENGDTLILQPFLMSSRSDTTSESEVDTIFRSSALLAPLPYAFATS